jgi:hypothetical protein
MRCCALDILARSAMALTMVLAQGIKPTVVALSTLDLFFFITPAYLNKLWDLDVTSLASSG